MESNLREVAKPAKIALIGVAKPTKIALIGVAKPTKIALIVGVQQCTPTFL